MGPVCLHQGLVEMMSGGTYLRSWQGILLWTRAPERASYIFPSFLKTTLLQGSFKDRVIIAQYYCYRKIM